MKTATVTPTINVLSTLFVKVPIRATRAARPIDLSQYLVQFQVVPVNTDITDNGWIDATWEHAAGSGTYYATLLVGPGGEIQLPVALYDVWVKVNGDPEMPVMKAGNLEITEV